MKVLITGGSRDSSDRMSQMHSLRAVTKSSCFDTGAIGKVRHLLNNPRFHYIHDSIFNLELIDSLVAKVDLVYHLAAVVGVEHYVGRSLRRR